MDISPKNNNFQKKNSKVIKQGSFDQGKLNELISNFSEVYIPEHHKKLKDFFVELKNYLESNLDKASNNANNYSNSFWTKKVWDITKGSVKLVAGIAGIFGGASAPIGIVSAISGIS